MSWKTTSADFMGEPLDTLILPAIWIPVLQSVSLTRRTAKFLSVPEPELWQIVFQRVNITSA